MSSFQQKTKESVIVMVSFLEVNIIVNIYFYFVETAILRTGSWRLGDGAKFESAECLLAEEGAV